MSAEEFSEWQAYYTLEPFGELRADLRSGVVASLLYNINRPKTAEALSPADFMLFQEREKPADETPPDSDAMRSRFLKLFPAQDKKSKRKKD